jgi:hypothetical protein
MYHLYQRLWSPVGVECVDQEARIATLPPCTGSKEAVQLLMRRALTPLRHLLKGPEAPKVAGRAQYLLDGLNSKRANQLVLEVRVTDEELRPGLLERATEDRLLTGIAQSDDPSVRVELAEERCDAMSTAERDDTNACGGEIKTSPRGQRLDSYSVALTLDDDKRTHSNE